MRALRLALVAVAALAVAYVGIAVYVADQVTRVDRSPTTRSPQAIGPSHENVSFRTSDGLLLRGWFFPFSELNAAILVHGKDTNRLASDNAIRIARWLRDEGYSLLLFDMRGHGESEGERFSLGQHERNDVAAAFDHLVGRGFDPRRIVVYGESMGAAVAIQAVQARPAISAVIADSAYANGRSIVDEAGPGETGLPDWYTGAVVLAAKLLYGLDAEAVDPDRVVRTHETTPFLVIHCEDDTLIRPAHARRLSSMTADLRSILWIAPDCGHAQASERHADTYRLILVRFLRAVRP